MQIRALKPPKNLGPLKQRRFSEDYRRDSKQCARSSISISISVIMYTRERLPPLDSAH
ncbi:hypothetical protein TSAR_009205 [Trichomalopsis sarcophagae]|uniref:Uncharacterized protein n=1 Tax=Trichomalopsis sarcophagae TaxID=543379 RepID=A0A232EQT4_9HYME|nr:hypothetical protein TSAR_009205 [Trichomalopsis sarcophagae]